MSYGVGCRCGSDPVLPWLWHRLAATALIRPLAWEPPHAGCVTLKRQKDQKKKKSSTVTAVAWVTAVVQVRFLAWELPHATVTAKKQTNKKKKQKKHA